jgi:hypothetical protein
MKFDSMRTGSVVEGGTVRPGTGMVVEGGTVKPGTGKVVEGGTVKPGTGMVVEGGTVKPGTGRVVLGSTVKPGTGRAISVTFDKEMMVGKGIVHFYSDHEGENAIAFASRDDAREAARKEEFRNWLGNCVAVLTCIETP